MGRNETIARIVNTGIIPVILLSMAISRARAGGEIQ